MKVDIPKQYVIYFEMLVTAGVYKDINTALSKVFEVGLDETEADLETIGNNSHAEPDMDMRLLQGKFTSLEVPDAPEYQRRIETISKAFAVPLSETASIILLFGLFHHYSALKHCQPYQSDPQFRREVRALPHEPDEDMYDFDEQGEWYDEEDRSLYSDIVDEEKENGSLS